MERNSAKGLVVLQGFYCNSIHKYVYLVLKLITKAHHLKCFSAETAIKKKERKFKLLQVEVIQNIFLEVRHILVKYCSRGSF